jgi:hypothetical protein
MNTFSKFLVAMTVLVALSILSSAIAGDVKRIALTNGEVVVGEIIDEGETAYLVRIDGGDVVRVPYAQIDSVSLVNSDKAPTTVGSIAKSGSSPQTNPAEVFADQTTRKVRQAMAGPSGNLTLWTGLSPVVVADISKAEAASREFVDNTSAAWSAQPGVSIRSGGSTSGGGRFFCPIRCDSIKKIWTESAMGTSVFNIEYETKVPNTIKCGWGMRPKNVYRCCMVAEGPRSPRLGAVRVLEEEIRAYCNLH